MPLSVRAETQNCVFMTQSYIKEGFSLYKEIAENLKAVENRIARAAERAGRKREDIILLGATKTVEPERIQYAVNSGLRYIGENRVQELTDKFGQVQNAQWHFIGHLQTNKVKYIIDKAALIHAADTSRLMDEISRQAEKHGLCAHVLLEVNASGEESKFGMDFNAVLPMIEENEGRNGVEIEGLMTIGPNTRDEAAVRKSFEKMRTLYESIGAQSFRHCRMQHLSMGMSGDYEIAIEEGANIVRIGSAIFGYRNYGGNQ